MQSNQLEGGTVVPQACKYTLILVKDEHQAWEVPFRYSISCIKKRRNSLWASREEALHFWWQENQRRMLHRLWSQKMLQLQGALQLKQPPSFSSCKKILSSRNGEPGQLYEFDSFSRWNEGWKPITWLYKSSLHSSVCTQNNHSALKQCSWDYYEECLCLLVAHLL